AKRLREIPGKVEFGLWDGQRLPVPDLGFNRVVATLDSMRAYDPAALFRDLRRVLRADGDGYMLQSVSHHGGLPHALAEAGWPELHELARTDDHTAVLLYIRPAESTPVAKRSSDGLTYDAHDHFRDGHDVASVSCRR